MDLNTIAVLAAVVAAFAAVVQAWASVRQLPPKDRGDIYGANLNDLPQQRRSWMRRRDIDRW